MTDAERQQRIIAALAAELARQGRPTGLDVGALAQAVMAALDSTERAPLDQGRTPDELSSANDG